MSNPTISIVMPAYNVAQYVEDAIKSIQAQTFTDWELIIVDDCSSDQTVNIIEKFTNEDQRIILIKRKTNSGGCRIPRFTAIENATGDWICDIDADDFIEPSHFEKLLSRLQDTQADMVLGQIIICDSNLNPTERTIPNVNFEWNNIISGKEAVKLTLNGWKISATGGLTRRSSWENYISILNPSDFNGYFADEIDRRHLLLTANKIAFISARYYYRQHAQSIVHNLSAKIIINGLRNISNLLDFVLSTFSDDKKILSEINTEYLDAIYRNQIKYLANSKKYTIEESIEIKEMLKQAHRRVKSLNMRFVSIKQNLLAWSYFSMYAISYTVVLYAHFRNKLIIKYH